LTRTESEPKSYYILHLTVRLMISIERFNETDLLAIMQMASQIDEVQLSPQSYLELVQQWPEGITIARCQNEIVGAIIGTISAPKMVRIILLGVKDGYREKGVGSALLQSLINRCPLEGIHRIVLEVRMENVGAIRFYSKFNFRISGTIIGFYKNGGNAYTMEKLI